MPKYISGDPKILAQKCSKGALELEKYIDYIISQSNQNVCLKDIYLSLFQENKITIHLTQFYGFCNRLKKEKLLNPPINSNLKKDEIISSGKKYKIITRNQIFRYLWSNEKTDISDDEFKLLCNKYPVILTINRIIQKFRSVYKAKSVKKFGKFITICKESNLKPAKTFVKNLIKDISPVILSITTHYSNAFVEGTNNMLKTVKRTSYGRCLYPLLRAKIKLFSFFNHNTHK